MAKKNQHVIPLGNGWAVKGEGSNRFTVITETQRNAITVARQIAKSNKSELFVHTKNGEIRIRDSYIDNPNSAKDKKR